MNAIFFLCVTQKYKNLYYICYILLKDVIIVFFFLTKCYNCYIVGIIEKYKYSFIIYTYNFNKSQINFNQNFVKTIVHNLYALVQ